MVFHKKLPEIEEASSGKNFRKDFSGRLAPEL
jgi:hypothetical protein